MATPWYDMEVANFTFLTAAATYTALGLTEFRGYDGNFAPWDLDALSNLPSGKIPFYAAEEPEITTALPSKAGAEDTVTVQYSLCYSAAGGAESRVTAEGAANTIIALYKANGYATLSSSSIYHFTISGPSVTALRADGTGAVLFWVFRWSITYTGNRTFTL